MTDDELLTPGRIRSPDDHAVTECLPGTVAAIRPCKICGEPAALFGVVDFNKNCNEARGVKLPLSGNAVYYRRCVSCGFLFTDYCDDWKNRDYLKHIYNSDYALVDPDYASIRPSGNARMIVNLFGAEKNAIDVLDFGGGNGALMSHLQAFGFPTCVTYDPFNPLYNTLPERKFNLVTCFETLEHAPDPAGCVKAIIGCLADDGMVLFSTIVQPSNFDTLGLSWWYVGPRNGHISIHSLRSLGRLWNAHDYKLMSNNEGLHIAFRTLPAYAQTTILIK